MEIKLHLGIMYQSFSIRVVVKVVEIKKKLEGKFNFEQR